MDTVRGLIRPFLTFSFILMLSYMVWQDKIEPREILTVVSLIVGFYFGERGIQKGANLGQQDSNQQLRN